MYYGTKLRLLWLWYHIATAYSLYYCYTNDLMSLFYYSIIWAFVLVIVGAYAGIHRYYTHRSFKTDKITRTIMLWLGVLQGIGKPITLVGIHRYHHAHSDTEKDIHSPKYSKWWEILLGYYKEPKLSKTYIKDLMHDKQIKFLQKNYFKVIIAINFILLLIHPALPGLLFGLGNLYVMYSTGIIINNLNHIGGSNNNFIYAMLTFGEGWHKNHHDDSKRYTNWIKWYQIDITGLVIKWFLKRDRGSIS